MAISNAEINQLLAIAGRGKMPLTGGPATNLKSCITETTPFDYCCSTMSPATGVMSLTSIFLVQNQVITNINFASIGAESGGTHLWYALYDDGRGSATANQLYLLAQTPDQTGAAALGANTNLGLSLNIPYTTTYTGIYYLGFMCVASGMPTLVGTIHGSASTTQIASAGTGSMYSGTAGSGLTSQAPSPSGTVTATSSCFYAYVS